MTAAEKFALARAFHDGQMYGYPVQAQAWITQQFDICLAAVCDVLRTEYERRQFRAIVARDNWLKENPFRDD